MYTQAGVRCGDAKYVSTLAVRLQTSDCAGFARNDSCSVLAPVARARGNSVEPRVASPGRDAYCARFVVLPYLRSQMLVGADA